MQILLAGDVFDAFNPPTEAVELYYKTLKALSREGSCPVIVIAGNHDSPERIEAPDPLARECGIIVTGYQHTQVKPFNLPNGLKVIRSAPGFIELQLPNFDYPLRLLLTPYANEYRLKRFLGKENSDQALRQLLSDHWQGLVDQYCDDRGVNVLMAHLFFANKKEQAFIEPEEEKPILHVGGAQVIFPNNIPKGIDYVALGHLHRRHKVSSTPCPIVYSGSPMAYSFSESGQQKSVTIIEAEPGKSIEYHKVPLLQGRQVLRKRFEKIETAKEWLMEHPNAIIELTLVSDTFLPAQTKQELYAINKDLFIIPEIQQSETSLDPQRTVNLNQRMDQLFEDYFKFKHKGQEPNQGILDLFKEALGVNNE